ncbi:MAG: hypothetical protein HY918_03365 [Candidatus Doudnabacteria bacterium]|nr:hypothetical protein [Candidatus Doudnabacteria bacterium]
MPGLGELLDRFFGRNAADNPTTDRIEVDSSKEARRIIGERLYDGAMAEITASAAVRKLVEHQKASDQHCAEHVRTEENLRHELEIARGDKRIESNKTARLNNLLNEVCAAIDSGRVLSSAEIHTGKRNALNAEYFQPTYLPVPKPTAPANNANAGGKTTADPASEAAEQPQS